jgi:hypothetical protein
MAFGEVPFNLVDGKAAVLDSSDTPGTSVDIGGLQSVNYTIDSDTTEVRGDGTIIAEVRGAKRMSGGISIARIGLTALAAMVGGTASTSGSTPAQITTLNESDAPVSRYFQLTAQTDSYDTTGSAYRVVLKKLSITGGPNETLDQDAFDSPTMDFSGVGVGGVLLTRSNYETKVALT